MIVLSFNTKIRDAVQLIRDGDAHPVVDLGDIRYSLNLSNTKFGTLIFTPFYKSTQLPVDWSYQYLYGMQSTLKDAILGPGPWSKSQPRGIYPEWVDPEVVDDNTPPMIGIINNTDPDDDKVRPNFIT